MVIDIRVKFDVSRTQSFFQKLPKTVQKEVGNGMFKIAKSYQRGLRRSLNRNSKRFDYKIFNGIQGRKISNNQSVVAMPQEGKWLDDMTPHWVSLKPGRKITEWAKKNGFKGRSIFVRPHPFIAEGYAYGRKSRSKTMQETMDMAISKSRK